jgi:hypothetical protein
MMVSRREVVYFASIFPLTLGLASTAHLDDPFLSLAQFNRFRPFKRPLISGGYVGLWLCGPDFWSGTEPIVEGPMSTFGVVDKLRWGWLPFAIIYFTRKEQLTDHVASSLINWPSSILYLTSSMFRFSLNYFWFMMEATGWKYWRALNGQLREELFGEIKVAELNNLFLLW